MRSFVSALALALAPLLAIGHAGAHPPMSEAEVRALLGSEGFRHVDDVDFEASHGLWEAEIVTADGEEIELHVDPLTGRILFTDGSPYLPSTPPPRIVSPAPVRIQAGIPPLNEADVHDILLDAGFYDIHDVEFDDDRWRAEARGLAGADFEIEIDAVDGRIVDVDDD